MRRARAAGFSAILLSIDTAVRSKREREKRAGLDLPKPHLAVPTLLDGVLHPAWAWHFLTSDTISFPNIGPADHRSREKLPQMFDGTVNWNDLEWIRELWDGPILVKGVIRPEEAIRAADEGVDGVIVSNHGGRQLDHLPATIDVLPEIADAVGDRIEVLVDSGFRRGSDIAAALALGAKAVLLGRAHLYGLAAAGEAGVRHCIDLLADEFRMTLALCGARSVAELDRSLIRRRSLAADSLPASPSTSLVAGRRSMSDDLLTMDASHQTVRLARGRHPSPGLGVCVMELASMLADEPFSDRPASASPVIAAFLRTYNDGVDDERRRDLYPLAALIVGTARGRRLERERASRCLEFARSLGAGAPAGRGAIGIASAEASGSWAALAVLRAGPASETHPRALALARELVQLGAQARRPGWLMWLRRRDPGVAVEEALAQLGPGGLETAAAPEPEVPAI